MAERLVNPQSNPFTAPRAKPRPRRYGHRDTSQRAVEQRKPGLAEPTVYRAKTLRGRSRATMRLVTPLADTR